MSDMRKFHMIGLALVAVFAFSAVAVANASAAEWLCKEGGVLKACAKVTKVDSEGTLTLSDKTVLGLIMVECSGTNEGTIGLGAADTITAVLNLAKTTTDILCTVTEGSNICGTAEALVEAVHLPWSTTLTAAAVDDLTTGGAGSPGWHIVCSNGTEDECTKALAELAMKNEVVGGVEVVDALFNAAENVACKAGNAKVSGLVTILSTEALVTGIATS
jgi:hypothetical protein